MAKKLPFDHIDIGPYRYEVKTRKRDLNRVQVEVAQSLHGAISHVDQKVFFHPEQGPDQLAGTVLHEVLHGCLQDQSLEGDVEEPIVTALAPALLDTLRRNPQVTAFLLKWELRDE